MNEQEFITLRNGKTVVNSYYVFTSFLKAQGFKLENVWMEKSANFETLLTIGVTPLLDVNYMQIIPSFVLARIQEFLGTLTNFKKCNLVQPYYQVQTTSGDLCTAMVFSVPSNFSFENLTKGIAPGDIIGFCTPEEEAALEPHLYDIELCVME